MSDERRQSRIGPAVFLITVAATAVFFWWLLVYDHGATPPA
ncbi:MAG: hypothetical protein ACE5GS_10135 [Kiloniellaceae bacterium]